MNATLTRPRRTTPRKPHDTPARDVRVVLLELAYRLHATKPIKRPPVMDPRGCES